MGVHLAGFVGAFVVGHFHHVVKHEAYPFLPPHLQGFKMVGRAVVAIDDRRSWVGGTFVVSSVPSCAMNTFNAYRVGHAIWVRY